MQAACFYDVNPQHAIALQLLNKAAADEGFESCTAFERQYLSAQSFKGALGDLTLIHDHQGILVKVFIGSDAGNDALAIASVVNRLPARCYRAESTLSLKALVAWSLAQYRFDYYKASTAEPRQLAVDGALFPAVLSQSRAVFFVRDLINMPANLLTPAVLADKAAALAREYGADFYQCVGEDLLRENYPAIYAVGAAAAVAPRLISLTWGDETHPKITLVGKGVCFDSGGLDIKPSKAMRIMKKDMGGAAQVLGLAQWIMSEALPLRLAVLIPAVENAVGSHAYRPGDILTMRNGLTVEVDNTDAEGRLVLADALVKACEGEPALLIDFSTLTGAARVAVGTEISALFTPDDNLAAALQQAGDVVGDPLWRMPLFSGYRGMLDSTVADLVNSTASPYAGAITAGLFLERFVTAGIPWVHFDMMAWNVSSKPGRPEGGEAMGIFAVIHYLRTLVQRGI